MSNSSQDGSWTEAEHTMFLEGLQRFGWGKWKEISDNFVPGRTRVQVATHAHKFLARFKRLEKKKPTATAANLNAPNFQMVPSIAPSPLASPALTANPSSGGSSPLHPSFFSIPTFSLSAPYAAHPHLMPPPPPFMLPQQFIDPLSGAPAIACHHFMPPPHNQSHPFTIPPSPPPQTPPSHFHALGFSPIHSSTPPQTPPASPFQIGMIHAIRNLTPTPPPLTPPAAQSSSPLTQLPMVRSDARAMLVKARNKAIVNDITQNFGLVCEYEAILAAKKRIRNENASAVVAAISEAMSQQPPLKMARVSMPEKGEKFSPTTTMPHLFPFLPSMPVMTPTAPSVSSPAGCGDLDQLEISNFQNFEELTASQPVSFSTSTSTPPETVHDQMSITSQDYLHHLKDPAIHHSPPLLPACASPEWCGGTGGGANPMVGADDGWAWRLSNPSLCDEVFSFFDNENETETASTNAM